MVKHKQNTCFGAPDRIRTCDLRLRRPTLYPLSYRRAEAKSSSGRDGAECGAEARGQGRGRSAAGIACPEIEVDAPPGTVPERPEALSETG